MSNTRRLRRPRTTRSTSRSRRGSKRRLCRSSTTKGRSSSPHQALLPLPTSRLRNSCSTNKTSRTRPSLPIAPSQSKTSSRHRARRHSSSLQSTRSCNTLKSAILASETSTLPPRVPSRRRPWPSWRTSGEKKRSTTCTKSITSSTHRALTSRNSTPLTHSARQARGIMLRGHLRVSRPPTP